MKTKRGVLASLLTGNSAALQEYQRERNACFILLIVGEKQVGYCIFPDLSIKAAEADFIRAKMEKNKTGFKVSFSDCKMTFEEFEADLLANPSKHYKVKGVIQRVFFTKD